MVEDGMVTVKVWIFAASVESLSLNDRCTFDVASDSLLGRAYAMVARAMVSVRAVSMVRVIARLGLAL